MITKGFFFSFFLFFKYNSLTRICLRVDYWQALWIRSFNYFYLFQKRCSWIILLNMCSVSLLWLSFVGAFITHLWECPIFYICNFLFTFLISLWFKVFSFILSSISINKWYTVLNNSCEFPVQTSCVKYFKFHGSLLNSITSFLSFSTLNCVY